jgi:predicted nucleic acid-binding protein
VSRAVLDANVAIALVIALPYSPQARAVVEELSASEIYVPALWEYEVVSALRKAVALGTLAVGEVEQALDDLFALPNAQVGPDRGLHRDALKFAERLGQVAAYDAQYLALAARLGAEFWTADRRLAERVRASGLSWVHDISIGR